MYNASSTFTSPKMHSLPPSSHLTSAEAILRNVAHIPLAAEPLLYINVLGTAT